MAALGALLVSFRNSGKAAAAASAAAIAAEAAAAAKAAADDNSREIIATRDGVFEVGKQLDGRLKELLEVTEHAALAKGRVEGRASERAESALRAEKPTTRRRSKDV